MSKAGKILVGLTAVFALFMLCMALLGGALLFITSSSSSNLEVVNGIGVDENITPDPASNNDVVVDSNPEVGFAFANIIGEIVKLVALIAVIGGVLLLFWHRPITSQKAPIEPH